MRSFWSISIKILLCLNKKSTKDNKFLSKAKFKLKLNQPYKSRAIILNTFKIIYSNSASSNLNNNKYWISTNNSSKKCNHINNKKNLSCNNSNSSRNSKNSSSNNSHSNNSNFLVQMKMIPISNRTASSLTKLRKVFW